MVVQKKNVSDTEKLQTLWDTLQIERVLNQYCRGFDRCDVESAKDTYWPGALDDHPGFVGDAAGMCVHWDNEHQRLFDSTQHYITNNDIDIDGDTAHAESYVLTAARKKDSLECVVVGGRYVRRLEKRDGEWRIAATVCFAHWCLDENALQGLLEASAPSARDKSDPVYQRPLNVTRPPTSSIIDFE